MNKKVKKAIRSTLAVSIMDISNLSRKIAVDNYEAIVDDIDAVIGKLEAVRDTLDDDKTYEEDQDEN